MQSVRPPSGRFSQIHIEFTKLFKFAQSFNSENILQSEKKILERGLIGHSQMSLCKWVV